MSESVVLLDNQEVRSLLDMAALLPRLERAYEALGNGEAANGPRVEVSVPSGRVGTYHRLKTMSGGLPGEGVQAVRLDSDLLRWSTADGQLRREKVTRADEDDLRVGAENGLVVLYRTETAEPLLLAPDGELQRFRVGATSGLAADHLARPDATSVGLLGSGWQASAQLLALDAIRNLDEVAVYSPNRAHREAFADTFDDRLDANVEAVDDAETAVAGKDVIDAATDSLAPVIDPAWVVPGVHVSSVKRQELTARAIDRADVAVVHSADQSDGHRVVVEGEEPIPAADDPDGWWTDPIEAGMQPLADVVADRASGREAAEEATLFANNIGLGLQFAACGLLLYERARDREAGRELPAEWFLQDVV